MTDKKFSQLEKSILKTLSYYDIFDYPLTAEEIWRWLYVEKREDLKKDLGAVIEALETSANLKELIDEDEGYYFFQGRREIVETRRERLDIDKKKWKIAYSAVRWLRMAPFIKYVAVCNSLAYNNAKSGSDIDFFIMTEPGKMFISRFFITWLIQMLGYRRYKNKIKNRVCLSFYVTSDNLDFRNIILPEDDPHFAFWLSQFIPLYDEENFHEKIQKENDWVRETLPHAFVKPSNKKVKKEGLTTLVQKIFEGVFMVPTLGPWLSQAVRDSQMKKMQINKGSVMNENNTNVVINDQMLKFHEEDRREEYREKFINQVKEVLGDNCG